LRVPALRERMSDVPELINMITERFATRMGITPPVLSGDAMEMLLAHDYRGNVRELENVIERALTLCEVGAIQASDIELRESPGQGEAAGQGALPNTLPDRLEDIERTSIVRALEEARYNKTAAARALGISFRALRYRIKKLGIE
jgi:two-component system response regulator PilR (NtrC family)